jgi:hypothetical protein
MPDLLYCEGKLKHFFYELGGFFSRKGAKKGRKVCFAKRMTTVCLIFFIVRGI